MECGGFCGEILTSGIVSEALCKFVKVLLDLRDVNEVVEEICCCWACWFLGCCLFELL